VPGNVGTLVWKELRRRGMPFGVEVVGDPWTGFAPGVIKTPFRPIFRCLFRRSLKAQCRKAVAALYVTTRTLQRWYPPGGYTVGVSDVNLEDADFAAIEQVDAKVRRYLEPRSASTPWCVVHIGTMSQHYKDHPTLLRGVASCIKAGVPIRLRLIGDGAYRDTFKVLASDLGIAGQTTFVGRIPAGQPIRDALDEADLFVLPSSGGEGLPRVIVEAMARGVPCIASDVGGVAELLEPSDVFPPKSAECFADKLAEVLNDPVRLTRMAHRNRKESEQYHSRVLTPCREEFLRQLRDRTRAARALA
jgi:glycosyltransferase involved in cell wall biosynthesis